MSDPLVVYSIVSVILLLSGFGTLYWMAKFSKTSLREMQEAEKKTKEAVEKPWFWPLFVALVALSCATVAQDVLALIPRFSTLSLPLLKYIFALGLGTIGFMGGIIGRRKLRDLQS